MEEGEKEEDEDGSGDGDGGDKSEGKGKGKRKGEGSGGGSGGQVLHTFYRVQGTGVLGGGIGTAYQRLSGAWLLGDEGS